MLLFGALAAGLSACGGFGIDQPGPTPPPIVGAPQVASPGPAEANTPLAAAPPITPEPLPAAQPPAPPVLPPFDSSHRRIAVLLPLTGGSAALGHAMLQAIQLAAEVADAPPLDVKDTGGTPGGAASVAGEAAQVGDGIILGPLTGAETAAVAPVARRAGVPVLAFTSDPARAEAGVWVLGLTPGQQVRRLLGAAGEDGRGRIAALLAETPYGNALAAAVAEASPAGSANAVNVQRYRPGFQTADLALRQVSDYATRRDARDAQVKALRGDRDPATAEKAVALAAAPLDPPPFQALLLSESGDKLKTMLTLMPFYGVSQPQVRLLGPALWSREGDRLPMLVGAWYAAPDPAARAGYAAAYAARFGRDPPPLADLAYDAGALARVLGMGDGYTLETLTRARGFAGVDGILALQPDGSVHRGLAVFEVAPDGGKLVRPAPTDPTAPGV